MTSSKKWDPNHPVIPDDESSSSIIASKAGTEQETPEEINEVPSWLLENEDEEDEYATVEKLPSNGDEMLEQELKENRNEGVMKTQLYEHLVSHWLEQSKAVVKCKPTFREWSRHDEMQNDDYSYALLHYLYSGKSDVQKLCSQFLDSVKRSAQRCFWDTNRGALKNVRKAFANQYFDYFEFQKALRIQWREEEMQYLEENFRGKAGNPRPPIPTMSEITKEFESMYGPVNKSSSVVKAYLKNFLELKEEHIQNLCQRLEFVQALNEFYGEDEALLDLQLQREALENDKLELLQSTSVKSKVYDMNPYTNPAHLDWFLIPRPPPPALSTFFVRHPHLERLVEFRLPEKVEKEVKVIDGYWPSIADHTWFNPVIPFSVTSAPLLKSIVSEQQKQRWSPEGRKFFYDCVYSKMVQAMEGCSLGVSVTSFKENLRKNYQLHVTEKLFPGMSFEQVTHFLPEIFYHVKIPNVENLRNSKKTTILFPGYMRGILSPAAGGNAEAAALGIMKRVWSRIELLIKMRGGKLRIDEVDDFYKMVFGVSLIVERWGFSNPKKYVAWCNKYLDGGGAPRIRVNGDFLVLCKCI